MSVPIVLNFVSFLSYCVLLKTAIQFASVTWCTTISVFKPHQGRMCQLRRGSKVTGIFNAFATTLEIVLSDYI